MGWIMNTGSYADKPKIFNYLLDVSPHRYEVADPPYFTWSTGVLWNRYEAAIKFVNDTGQRLKLNKVAVKTVSCHSGGSQYWSTTGLVSPCYGYGAKYICYVRVSNDGEKTFQESSRATNEIPDITKSNMNSKGTSTTNTAKFGNPPFTGNMGLILRNYEFSTSPIIEIGGVAYLHLRIELLDDSKAYQTTIRFILNPKEMEIQFDQQRGPYIWRMESDGHWHLRRPLQVFTGNVWTDPENQGGNQP